MKQEQIKKILTSLALHIDCVTNDKHNTAYKLVNDILETPELTRKECGCNKDESCFTCNPEDMLEDFEDPKPSMDWEEEFDNTFDLDDYGKSTYVQDKVKQFIQSQITNARAELLIYLKENNLLEKGGKGV